MLGLCQFEFLDNNLTFRTVWKLKMHWMNIKFLFSSLFMQPQDVNFHGQEQVYGDLGEEMLEHAFEGKSNEQKNG